MSVHMGVDVGGPDRDDTALTVVVTLPTLLEHGANVLVQRAKSIVIATDQDYVQAGDFAREVKARWDATEAERVKLKAPALEMGKTVDNHFRGPLAMLDSAFKETKRLMGVYDTKKRQEQEAEERRLTEERRKATLEAEAREREAQKRMQAEEEARREAQRAADAEARRRVEAAEAEARGAREDAKRALAEAAAEREKAIEARRAQLRAEAQTREAVISMEEGTKAAGEATAAALAVRKEPVKAEGVARRTVWRFRLKNIDSIPRRYLKLDEEKLQRDIDRMKDAAQELLGDWVEVYAEEALIIGKGRSKP